MDCDPEELLVERTFRTSLIGDTPKRRLYSRLNWLALSYPTEKAALAASTPSTTILMAVLPEDLQRVSPALAKYTQDTITDDLWNRPAQCPPGTDVPSVYARPYSVATVDSGLQQEIRDACHFFQHRDCY